MNKKILIGLAILGIVILSVFLFLKKPNQKVIKIGVITSLTGNTASWGDMQRKATTIAIEDINTQGGVNGIPVKAIFEDDQGIPKVGVSAFKKLIATTDVPIVVGFPLSGVTLATAETANREQVVILSSGSTASKVGQAGPYVFRIMPSDEVQAAITADWAIDLGYKRIAVLYVENAWGRGLKDYFVKTFVAKGGIITQVESSTDDTSDFRSQLTKIKNDNPDAIYIPLYQRQAGLSIRQAREIGVKQQILGADVYETPELIEAGGSAVNGVLFTTFGRGKGLAQDEFAKKYEKQFGEKPGTYAYYAYDAFSIAVECIKSSGGASAKPEDLRSCLLGLNDYYGVTGLTSFKGSTSASGKTFDKKTISDGKFIEWSE